MSITSIKRKIARVQLRINKDRFCVDVRDIQKLEFLQTQLGFLEADVNKGGMNSL